MTTCWVGHREWPGKRIASMSVLGGRTRNRHIQEEWHPHLLQSAGWRESAFTRRALPRRRPAFPPNAAGPSREGRIVPVIGEEVFREPYSTQ